MIQLERFHLWHRRHFFFSYLFLSNKKKFGFREVHLLIRFSVADALTTTTTTTMTTTMTERNFGPRWQRRKKIVRLRDEIFFILIVFLSKSDALCGKQVKANLDWEVSLVIRWALHKLRGISLSRVQPSQKSNKLRIVMHFAR